MICVLFDTLCSGDSPATGAGTELVLGPDESELLGGLGEGEASGPGGGDFPEYAFLPEREEGATRSQHPTPEPSGALLFAAGLGVVATTIRRRREG